jgi:hypothetical protein
MLGSLWIEYQLQQSRAADSLEKLFSPQNSIVSARIKVFSISPNLPASKIAKLKAAEDQAEAPR